MIENLGLRKNNLMVIGGNLSGGNVEFCRGGMGGWVDGEPNLEDVLPLVSRLL